MTKFVVVVFSDEAKAYEGTNALKALHNEGNLTVYGMAVAVRDAKGVVSVKRTESAGPLGMAVGGLLGGMVGLFGGPVGAAIGMNYGVVAGGLTDMFNAGVGSDFVKAVSDKLAPGKSAVVAEVAEDWVTPLDARMQSIGGVVIREWRSDFEDEQIEKEARARQAELAHLRAEFKQAKAETKANLKAHINDTETKLRAAAERAHDRERELQEETQAKVQELQTQAAAAREDAKARINQRISEIHAETKRRSEKLKQVWEQTKRDLAA